MTMFVLIMSFVSLGLVVTAEVKRAAKEEAK